ncbi:MAG: transporter [Evtepia sp.]|jgi:energy-coupling factor transport system permease protein|nr:transporter [Evtepia sp.]
MALRDITLGQYFPGSSLIHKLDPRSKLVFIFLYIVALFLASFLISYGVMILVLMVGILLSGIRFSVFRKGLKPVVIIILFTAIMNLLVTRGGEVLFSYGILQITENGAWHAFFMMLRIILLLMSTLLLTYTTSPLMLTDGLDRLMSPLKALKLPVHDFTMIMSIALRFIPTLIQETDKIISAQKARGADFESGHIIARAKALIPILIPLFISAFRRADELSIAMDCRCYNDGNHRTRLRQLKYHRRDFVLIAFGLLLCTLSGILRFFGL